MYMYLLRHIEILMNLMFECRQFASVFVGVLLLSEIKILYWNTQFSALLSRMLWHIELKWCYGQGKIVKKFGMNRKASSQEMYMSNMKAQPLMIQKFW